MALSDQALGQSFIDNSYPSLFHSIGYFLSS